MFEISNLNIITVLYQHSSFFYYYKRGLDVEKCEEKDPTKYFSA